MSRAEIVGEGENEVMRKIGKGAKKKAVKKKRTKKTELAGSETASLSPVVGPSRSSFGQKTMSKTASSKSTLNLSASLGLKPSVSAGTQSDISLLESEISVQTTKRTKVPRVRKPKKKTVKKRSPKAKVVKSVSEKTESEVAEEAEAERVRFLEERRLAIATERREMSESVIRAEHLELTRSMLTACDSAMAEAVRQEQEARAWSQYLECDGLPAPWDVGGMNTYLHLWQKELSNMSSVEVQQCSTRTVEAMQLLDKLEDILDDPFDCSERKLADWRWVAGLFRAHQARNLEYCTYSLLRDVKTRMNRIAIPTADFRIQQPLFSMCLFVCVVLPTSVSNSRTSSARSRIRLLWPEVAVDVLFPVALKCDSMAIRGMYTRYDHLSDTCPSFRCPCVPEYYGKTFWDATREHLICKMRYKYDNRVVMKRQLDEVVQEDGTVAEKSEDEDEKIPVGEMPPSVPFKHLVPSPSDFVLNTQRDEITSALQQFTVHDEHLLNLRKFVVLGGVYFVDLFIQPPQPQGMVSFTVFTSALTVPYQLETAQFLAKYTPPPPPEPGVRRTPEEIEAELLQQEKELDELIFLTINLPKHVYFLDVPVGVQWDPEAGGWTTRSVFDFKNIEERGVVTLRTGVFQPFALATLRWTNLPYQAWEIRPEQDGTVSFMLTCAILNLEFRVKGHTVAVVDIQSAPNAAFEQHLGQYYPFSKLRMIMRSVGIDVFPYFDTFLYVEGTCEKLWSMESHLYFIMALLSVVYNMTWSRWNMTMDFRSIVFQLRHFRFDAMKQANFSTVLVQLERALYIDCTEVSAEFSDAGIEGMRFFADLWNLIRSTSTKAIKNKISSADLTMVKTLYRLYKSVRFMSFS